jgi:hypothetical protein
MSGQTVVRGICASCKFGPQCVNHHGAAVVQCEQFEAGDWASSAVISPRHPHPDSGLCVECRMDPMCNRPRPAGGVWECRDYQ